MKNYPFFKIETRKYPKQYSKECNGSEDYKMFVQEIRPDNTFGYIVDY